MEITPREKRETELNPRRGSARLCANRFAPLQTVDRPKPGKLRDQDGRQAGCVRKHVLPSRFLIGLSRASDETRGKGLLNPSDPQLLRGRLAWRGRLARRPPRRSPSELAPLGPFDPSAGLERGQRWAARHEGPEEVLHGQDEDAVAQEALLPAVEQDRYPFAVNENPPSLMADLLRFRQLEWQISGRGSRKGAWPGEGAWRGIRRAGARRRSLRSAPSILRRPGRDLLSCCRFVLSSTSRGRGKAFPRQPGISTDSTERPTRPRRPLSASRPPGNWIFGRFVVRPKKGGLLPPRSGDRSPFRSFLRTKSLRADDPLQPATVFP